MPSSLVDTAMLTTYRAARKEFLRALNCTGSCRDPLSEFSESLVCELLDGTLAKSRTQPAYDLIDGNGRRVQVRYLSNPSADWRNEHEVKFTEVIDDYAVVFFEDLDLRAAILFPRETIAAVCGKLGKKHRDRDRTLQLTSVNFQKLLAAPDDFSKLGVRILL